MSISLDTLAEDEFAPVTVANTAAGQAATPLTGQLRLGGWSFLETAGVATVVEIRDGAVSGGETAVVISLPANGAETKTAPGKGLVISRACTVVVLTGGTVRGSLWVNPS